MKTPPLFPTVHPDPPAHVPSGLPRGMDGLGERIAEVELRLMAREAALQRRFLELRQGAQAALRPKGKLFPLAGVALLAWPFLPRRWRAHVSPGTVATVFSLGLPLVKFLMARRGEAPRVRSPAPTPVAQVDPTR